jgi:ankyrin repeat protein
MSRSPQLPPDADLRQLRNQAKDLRRAWKKGDTDAIRRIAQSHPRFSGLTPAEVAAARFVLADAQLVIARELGFDSWPKLKKHIDSLGQPATSLHELVTGPDMQALRNAIARDPESVNERNGAGLPPLYTAALYRNQPAIDFLLEHGATVDIFASAYLGKASDAERLLQRDSDLARATTPNGMTALHYAAMAGHFDVAEILLRHHSDVNAQDNRGRTALAQACHAGPWKSEPAEEIIQLLLDSGAKIDLFKAAAMGRTALIDSMLDQDGGLIDISDEQGRTALFHAAHNNRFAAVKLLVERGADVNRSDAVGIAALHRTSQECSDELIQYLINHGAHAHLCCHVACGDLEGTRRILARHPEAASEIFYEFNAVGYAIHSWQLGTLRILLAHGSTLSHEDQQHILRISNNDQELLDELLAIPGASAARDDEKRVR